MIGSEPVEHSERVYEAARSAWLALEGQRLRHLHFDVRRRVAHSCFARFSRVHAELSLCQAPAHLAQGRCCPQTSTVALRGVCLGLADLMQLLQRRHGAARQAQPLLLQLPLAYP